MITLRIVEGYGAVVPSLPIDVRCEHVPRVGEDITLLDGDIHKVVGVLHIVQPSGKDNYLYVVEVSVQ